MIFSTLKIMNTPEDDALSLFNQLSSVKQQIKALEEESKRLQSKLTLARDEGDLERFKDPDPEKRNTYRHDNAVFVFSPGRVTYDFKSCADVVEAETACKALKADKIALGLAEKKVSGSYWSIR